MSAEEKEDAVELDYETVSVDAEPYTSAELSEGLPLLQVVDNLLAMSYLIFLISDLRLLSATGRVNIKFETMAIDSDNVRQNNAATLAVLPSEIEAIQNESQNDGISPAQIMAALMVILRKEVQAKRKAPAEEDAPKQKGQAQHAIAHADSIIANITNRKNRKEVEEDMDSLLKAYNYMIGMDLKDTDEIPKVKAPRQRRASVGKSLLRRPLQAMQDATPNLQHGAANALPRPSFLLRHSNRDNKSSRNLLGNTFHSNQVGQVGDALFQMNTKGGDETRDRNLTEAEILDLMEDAVTTRKYMKLDFMRDFFREDSVSAVMIQSDARIVWINDWYPMKDLTYAVCVNKTKKEVLLVFRGAITKSDWAHAANWALEKVDNPIQENYENKNDKIDVHAGFYRYLFRTRKDTGTCKYDEIKTVVDAYGRNLIGDYSLVITGHSLGAALSTVFGMFASTDERFTARGPIQMITFGSPFVGGRKFLDAFRHQESARKIQYIRLHNVRDGVAHMPISWRGNFQHVGVGVKIHRIPSGCWKWCGQREPEAEYGKETSSWALYWKAFRENWFFNMPLPWNTARCHTLHELRKRLLPAVASWDETQENVTLEKVYGEWVYGEKSENKKDDS